MSKSANVKSLDAVRHFAAAVVKFREEAKLCVTQLEIEMQRIIGWLEHDRPGFWKRESGLCDRRTAEARVMLHKCRMRRVGDFRPSCFEEQKNVQHCKQQFKFAQQQLSVVKHWTITAHQEADEYCGRAVQLIQTLEHDVPRLIALLHHAVENLDNYSKVQLPSWSPSKLNFGDPAKYSDPSTVDDHQPSEPGTSESVSEGQPSETSHSTEEI